MKRENRATARQITLQGELLKVKPVEHYTGSMPATQKRGSIHEFSSQSRKRMLELFARFDRDEIGFANESVKFITLTYPHNMTDAQRAKRDLKVFIQRIRREFPDSWLVWRMEFQKRGAIHFHFMLGGVDYWDVTKAQDAWNEVSETDARNSLDMQTIRSMNGVMFYVSKYMAKPDGDASEAQLNSISDWKFLTHDRKSNLSSYVNVRTGEVIESPERTAKRAYMGLSVSHIRPEEKEENESQEWVGRFWGVSGRCNMPLAPLHEMLLIVTEQSWKWILSKLDSEFCRVYAGFTLFGENLAAMLKMMNTVQEAWYNDDVKWEWWEWRNKYTSQRKNAAARLVSDYNDARWKRIVETANALFERAARQNKQDEMHIPMWMIEYNEVGRFIEKQEIAKINAQYQ